MNNERILNIDGVVNFRDLGGYVSQDGRKTKWGCVFRSAQLSRLSETGINTMLEMDIRSVIDLRFSDETLRYPTIVTAVPNAEITAWEDQIESEQLPKSEDIKRSWKESLASNDPQQVREAMRINYPRKLYSHRAIYRTMLLKLSTGELPLVFHCAAGKDRTGVAAALILSLLEVDEKQIVEDYLLTQSEMKKLFENFMNIGVRDNDDDGDFQKKLASYPRHVVKPVFDADESYIQTLLEYVKDQHNNFKDYALNTLRVDQKDIDNLKTTLLEA